MPITDEHVREAFAHLKTIAAVHYQKSYEEQFDSVKLYGEYLGLDEAAFDELAIQTHDFVPEDVEGARGWIIIGFFLGLTAVDRSGQSS